MSGPHHEVLEGSEIGPWEPVGDVDLDRLDLPTRVFGLANLALFLCLLLPWYTRSGVGPSGSASAMSAGGWRWLIWLLSLACVIFVFLESVTSLRLPTFLTNARQRGQVFAAVAGVDLVLVLIAAFAAKAQPPSTVVVPAGGGLSTAFGGYLGLLAALAAMAAAVPGLRGQTLLSTRPTSSPAPAPEPASPPPSGPLYGPAVGSDATGPDAGRSGLPATDSRSVSTEPSPERWREVRAAPGGDPPTGWLPPQPPPPPPL